MGRRDGVQVVLAALSLLVGCEPDTEGLNTAPTADAGPDAEVGGAANVVLDGSSSRDPDGRIVEYRWIQASGPRVELTAAEEASVARFVAPDTSAELTFTLVVVDDGGALGRDDVTITVDADQLPVADAGEDQEASISAEVALDGSASQDPDGQIVAFSWVQTRGVISPLDDPTSVQPSFIAPDRPSLLAFTLTVEDNEGNTATDEVVVAVRDNLSPIALAGPDIVGEVGTEITLDGTESSDPDGEIVSYAWATVSGPSAAISGPAEARASMIVPIEPGVIEVELTVVDDRGASATDRVRVIPAGSVPDLSVAYPPPDADFEARVNSTIVTGRASDPNGTEIVEITVDGTPATLDPDDPTRFVGRAAVMPPRSTMTIVAVDEAGERTTMTREVQSQIAYREPTASVYDATSRRLLVFTTDALIEINRATGDRRRLFSLASLGQRTIISAAPYPATGEIFIIGVGRNIIQAVDVDRGTARIISSVNVGSGIALDEPSRLVFDADNDRLIVLNGINTLIAVEVATGNRTVLAGPDRGTGPDLRRPLLAVDRARDRVLAVLDSFFGTPPLVEIDPATGDRVELTQVPFTFSSPANLLVDEATGLIYASTLAELGVYDRVTDEWTQLVNIGLTEIDGPAHLDPASRDILFVLQDQSTRYDLDAGTTETVLERSIGTGVRFDSLYNDLEYDEATHQLFMLAQAHKSLDGRRVFSVDPDGGDREVVSAPFPLRTAAERLSYNRAADRVLVPDRFAGLWSFGITSRVSDFADSGEWWTVGVDGGDTRAAGAVAVGLEFELRLIDLASNSVSVISSASVGGGPGFDRPVDTAWDDARNRILLLDQERGLMEVDPDTGRRRVLVGRDDPAAPFNPVSVDRIVIDTFADRALFPGFEQIISWDLQTGAIQRIRPLPRIEGLALRPADLMAYTVRSTPGRAAAVIAIELESGEWVECSR